MNGVAEEWTGQRNGRLKDWTGGGMEEWTGGGWRVEGGGWRNGQLKEWTGDRTDRKSDLISDCYTRQQALVSRRRNGGTN